MELLWNPGESYSTVGYVLLVHLLASVTPEGYRSVTSFVSGSSSVSLRLLINQHDYFVG